MKPLTTILLLFIPVLLIGQEAPRDKELSKAEAFSLKTGTLIKRTFEDIGNVNKVKLQILTFEDLLSGETMRGVKMEAEVSKSYGNSTKAAFLDPDEVESLLTSIEILSEQMGKPVPEDYTEITFRARGGFEAGSYISTRKNEWNAYLKLEKYDSDSYVFLRGTELRDLYNILKAVQGEISKS